MEEENKLNGPDGDKILSPAQIDVLRGEKFTLFTGLFNEPGLKHLRTCSPAILSRLRSDVWTEEQQLESYCPIDSWK